MSEATPKKRKAEDGGNDPEYKNEGGGGAVDVDRCIQLANSYFTITIRQRRYWEFDTAQGDSSEITGKSLYHIPVNLMNTYLYTVKASDATTAETSRYTAIKGLMETQGWRVQKCGITMHNMIITQKDLTIASGSAMETLSFNNDAYLEIFKDTSMLWNDIKYQELVPLSEHLYNPRLVDFIAEAKDYESPLTTMGTMEIMKIGDRKTYTCTGSDKWCKGAINNTKWVPVPIMGGQMAYGKPDKGQTIFDPDHPTVFHPVFCRVTPIKGADDKLLKIRCRVQADMFITLDVRLPPDGTSYIGQGQQQFLHKPQDFGNLQNLKWGHVMY